MARKTAPTTADASTSADPPPSPTDLFPGSPLEYLSIGALRGKTHQANPKQHDVPAIAASIARFGFTMPLVIDDRSDVLVAGHGRLAGVSRLFSEGQPLVELKPSPNGVEIQRAPWPPPGIRVREDGQWLLPVIRHRFSDDDERDAYLIADNRLTEVGGWDSKALRAMMLRFSAVELPSRERLASIGFSAKEFNRLMSGLRVSTKGEKPRDGVAGLTYKVVVTCVDEEDQARLIDRMEGEGYAVASLIA